MSMGEGGYARLINNDGVWITYAYLPYSLNIDAVKENYSNHDHLDGVISIKISSLVEPEIHEKIKRWPSGRKEKIIKRVKNDVNYTELLDNGLIKVKNSKYSFKVLPIDIDSIAMKLIFKIFNQYQETGVIPESLAIHY